MEIAFTRTPSPYLHRCPLIHRSPQPIDIGKAREQHREYEFILAGLQTQVVRLTDTPHLPHGVFVQHTAVVCDELAIATTFGQDPPPDDEESALMMLAQYREPIPLLEPARFAGGDVIIARNRVFVGLTGRTNRHAFEQIREVMQTELGRYRVRPVRVRSVAHLKSGCSYIGRGTCVVNRHWVDARGIEAEGFRCIDVASEEPFAADTLTVNDTVIVAASCPRTADAIARAGFSVLPVDISEFEKVEAGVSGLCLLFTVIPALMACHT